MPPYDNLERFHEFHRNNPEVFALIQQITYHLRDDVGLNRCSIDMIYHRVRWLHFVETRSADDFKLNNNHTAFYARVLCAIDSSLRDFFETRRQREHFEIDLIALGLSPATPSPPPAIAAPAAKGPAAFLSRLRAS